MPTENTNFHNFIKSILQFDGYESLSYRDCMLHIVSEFEYFNEWLKENNYSLYTNTFNLIAGIEHRMTDDMQFNTAVIKAIAKIIRMMPNSVIKLRCPVYNRLMYTKVIKCAVAKYGSTYKEQNKYAKEFFENLAQYK